MADQVRLEFLKKDDRGKKYLNYETKMQKQNPNSSFSLNYVEKITAINFTSYIVISFKISGVIINKFQIIDKPHI